MRKERGRDEYEIEDTGYTEGWGYTLLKSESQPDKVEFHVVRNSGSLLFLKKGMENVGGGEEITD
jgi:hypothetical protein